MKKFKLISSLATLVATTSIVATSCAVVNKNSNNNTIASGINIANIPWVTRTKYEYKTDNTIQEDIINAVINDNVSTFVRYPGLEDAISITVTLNSPTTGKATISITANNDVYSGSTGWTSSYESKLLPAGGELNINTSTISDTLYVDTASYDKQCEIFASTIVNNVITAVDISKVETTLTGTGITTAVGSVSSNKGYVKLTIGTTAGVARLIIKVTDSKGNVGSTELVINVKKKWEEIGLKDFVTLETGVSISTQTSLFINRDEKIIAGWIHVETTFNMGPDCGSKIATFKENYYTSIRQGGSVSGYSNGSWYSIDLDLKVHPTATIRSARLNFYYVYAIN